MDSCRRVARCSGPTSPAADVARHRAFRSRVLADLHRQLAFAPETTQRKRLESAEALVRDLDPDRGYPVDFIVFKLTGYRPDDTVADVIPGVALRADLVTMIQLASRGCLLPWDGPRGRPLDLEAVAQRLGRSKRSLRTLREQGLVCWWTRPPDEAPRLGCPPDMLDWFVKTAPLEPVQRLGSNDRTTIEDLARRCSSEHCDLAALSRAVATRTGNSVDVVRGVLRRAADAGRLNLPRGRRLQRRDGTLALRCWRRGLAAATIGRRLGVTVPSVHRAVRREQLARVRRLIATPPIQPVDGPPSDPPALRWDTTLMLGTEASFETSMVHDAAAACATLGQCVRACSSRPSGQQWEAVEDALQRLTRQWWGLLRAMAPVLELALTQWAGRSVQHVPLPVLRRVLPGLVDAAIDTVARLDFENAARLPDRTRAAADRRLVVATRLGGDSHAGTAQGVFLLRHTTWRLLLPDPRWERAADRLHTADADMAAKRFALHGHTMHTIDAMAKQSGATAQSIAAKTGALRTRLHTLVARGFGARSKPSG